jgi:hypothetical protein
MEATLAPFAERLVELEAAPQRVFEILKAGAERVRPIARQTMAEVRECLGIMGAEYKA